MDWQSSLTGMYHVHDEEVHEEEVHDDGTEDFYGTSNDDAAAAAGSDAKAGAATSTTVRAAGMASMGVVRHTDFDGSIRTRARRCRPATSP